MKQSVYIETTVISYLTARLSRDLIRAAHQQITQEWWLSRKPDFDLYVSELVAREAAAGDKIAAEERLLAIDDIPSLGVSAEAEKLADELVKNKALPAKAVLDALHISIAAAHHIDYLLSWNCKHIANAEMQSAIKDVCLKNGFTPPIICTPEELLGGKP